jgi:hypothetical protein
MSFSVRIEKRFSRFLDKVIHFVEEHMDDPEFGVAMLSTKVAMSQPVLYKNHG